ncbi:tetratricopeptide repeat protein, partial [Schaalia georgiae]
MNAIDPIAERNARALQYSQEGRGDLAIPLFEEVLAGRVRVLGTDHPDT